MPSAVASPRHHAFDFTPARFREDDAGTLRLALQWAAAEFPFAAYLEAQDRGVEESLLRGSRQEWMDQAFVEWDPRTLRAISPALHAWLKREAAFRVDCILLRHLSAGERRLVEACMFAR